MLAIVGKNANRASSDFVISPSLSADARPLSLASVRSRFEGFFELVKDEKDASRRLFLEARILQETGKHDEALRRLDEAERVDDRSFDIVRAAVSSLRRLDRSVDALQRLEAFESRRARRTRRSTSGRSGPRSGAEIGSGDLGRTGSQLLASLPKVETISSSVELRVALTSLIEEGAIRINCGGSGFECEEGRKFHADRFFTGGRVLPTRTKSVDGAPTLTNQALYREERQFPKVYDTRRAYRVPVPVGRYRLRFHWNESFRQDGQSKRFDLLIEGEVAEKWNPPRGGGPFVKHDFVYETELEIGDGSFDIGFRPRGVAPSVAAFEIIPVE